MTRNNNPVGQVLATKGNLAILASGTINDLGGGQIGIFDANSGVVATTASKQIYFAVGVDDANGNLKDIKKSAGQYIQVNNISSISAQCVEGKSEGIFDITDFKVECDTDYAIRIGVENQRAFQNYGFNTPSKTFAVRSSCCETCATCASGDVNDMVFKLVNNINQDPDKLFKADFITSQRVVTVTGTASATTSTTFTLNGVPVSAAITTGDSATVAAGKIVAAINALTDSPFVATNNAGVVNIKSSGVKSTGVVYVPGSTTTGLTMTNTSGSNISVAAADYATFVAANPGVTLGIRITTIPETVQAFAQVNLKYEHPRGTVLTVNLIEGFNCTGKVTQIQAMKFEQGSGYDIAQAEYEVGGQNGAGIYKQSSMTGFLFENSYPVLAEVGTKYTMIAVRSTFESSTGYKSTDNVHETTIAIPCGDTNTRDTLNTFIDSLGTAMNFEWDATVLGGCSCAGTYTPTANNTAGIALL